MTIQAEAVSQLTLIQALDGNGDLMQNVRDTIASDLFNEQLEQFIANANKNVTHADFIAGVQDRSMGFKCMNGEPIQLATRSRKIKFNVLALLYLVGPSIVIPLLAYFEKNWWLLVGVFSAAVGTRFAAHLIYSMKIQNAIRLLLFTIFSGSWLIFGIHNTFTIYSLSALWGFALFVLAERIQKTYALASLVESADIFNATIAQKKIVIFRPGQEEID